MAKANRKLTEATVLKPHKPTPDEEAALTAYQARRAKRSSARIKVTKSKAGSAIGADHTDLTIGTVMLMNAMGTASTDFMQGLLTQLSNAASQRREPDEGAINFMLAVVNGIAPRDEIEAMLASQMAAVHMATMTFARRLAHVENIPQQDSAERAFNKLARTFTTQIEALKRYRSDGSQTVRVERVTVEAGGQAIVGAVSAPGGGGRDEK
ncbi:hypothetical protein [Methylobacterium sp. WSM2598]|uniref:hypothetical protein n=1 Tax=Methylobacterium sp. WSM2598 TaxID=398261 RepID=UPI0012F660EF|nr:hypothetical protein [Methylobacterium sp. WSM2598]